MKIDRAISIELRYGQKLTLSLKEAAKLARTLEKFLEQEGARRKKRQTAATTTTSAITTATKGKRRGRKKGSRSNKSRRAATKKSKRKAATTTATAATTNLSNAKKHEILDHINKKISETPRTLTNLLKGASYSQSQIPVIRELVESQQNIKAKAKGKRTVYLKRKAKATTQAAAPEKQTATTTSS